VSLFMIESKKQPASLRSSRAIAKLVSPAANAQTSRTRRNSKPWPQQAVRGAHGMVATTKLSLASWRGHPEARRQRRRRCSAVAFALAWLNRRRKHRRWWIHVDPPGDGKTTFFDYREVAPGKPRGICIIGRDANSMKKSRHWLQIRWPYRTVAGLEWC